MIRANRCTSIKHYANITVAILATVMFVFFASCQKGSVNKKKQVVSRDSLATMSTIGVSSLISDSGMIKYKIIAETWDVYDKADPPRWDFLRGLYIQKYDNDMNLDAKIKADTAVYYTKDKLWDLRSHVVVRNQKGEKFDTEQLYWDEGKGKVYSDCYIRIQQQEKIITGYGFRSNDKFTDYTIFRSAGIFPVQEKPSEPDVANADPALLPQDEEPEVNVVEAPEGDTVTEEVSEP